MAKNALESVHWERVRREDLRDGDAVREVTVGEWCTHIANAHGFRGEYHTVYERQVADAQ